MRNKLARALQIIGKTTHGFLTAFLAYLAVKNSADAAFDSALRWVTDRVPSSISFLEAVSPLGIMVLGILGSSYALYRLPVFIYERRRDIAWMLRQLAEGLELVPDNSPPFEGVPAKMRLEWRKCVGDKWCPFLALNLTNVQESGVYVIWHSGGRIVYVGQGVVAERIAQHRASWRLGPHDRKKMLVTWARLEDQHRDGVERYLAETLDPVVVGSARLKDPPIRVNLPWPWSRVPR